MSFNEELIPGLISVVFILFVLFLAGMMFNHSDFNYNVKTPTQTAFCPDYFLEDYSLYCPLQEDRVREFVCSGESKEDYKCYWVDELKFKERGH